MSEAAVELLGIFTAKHETIWGTTRNLSAQFKVSHSEILYARFKVRQDSLDLLARTEVGQNSQDLFVKFGVQGAQDLLGKFEAQTYRDIFAKLVVGQGSLDLPGKLEVGQDSWDLLGRFEAQVTAEFLGRFGVNQDVEDLVAKFEAQAIANLLGKANIIHSEDLLGKFEGQTTAEFLGRFGVNQDVEDLVAKFEAQAIANLLGKFDAQIIQDLSAKFGVGQDSRELLGKTVIRRDGAPVDLPARFVMQVILDLLAKAEVGQDSTDLLAEAEVGQNSTDLLSKAVIIHPAYPAWLKAIFSIRLKTAELHGKAVIEHSASVELLGRAVIRLVGTSELLGKAVIEHGASMELLGEIEIQHVGLPVELACNFITQDLDDLTAKLMVVPPIPGYITWRDPANWINVVMGTGRGFIAMPWVEADTVVKVTEDSSVRVTSTQVGRQYKKIIFGWEGQCARGLDSRREVPVEGAVPDLGAACTIRGRDVKNLLGALEVAHRSSEDLLGKADITHSVDLLARFYMFFRHGEDLRGKFQLRHEISDLPAEVIIRQSDVVELKAGIVGLVRHVDLACSLIVRHSAPPPYVEYPLSYVFTKSYAYDVMFDTLDGIGPVSIAESEHSIVTISNSQRKLVGTSSGILYAVYHRKLSGEYQIYVKESADYGLTWTNETRISTYVGMENDSNLYASIAVDSRDRLHVVWIGYATGFSSAQIWYALYDGSWATPVRISTYAGMQGEPQYYPCIAVDSQNRLHVVWYGQATGYTTYDQVWYALYDGSWATPVRISTYAGMDSNYQRPPCITVDSGDQLHVVWYGRATGYTTNYQIWYAVYTGSWADPVRISTYAGMDSNHQYTPCITVDSGDQLHVVWYGKATDFTTDYQIWYAVYTGSWADPVRISTYAGMDNENQYSSSIIVDKDDYLHVVWYGIATGYPGYTIWYAEYVTSWLGPEALQSSGTNKYPNLMVPPPEAIIPEIECMFEVGQDREDLLGKCVVRHVGAPIELFGKLVMRRVGISVELLGKGVIKNIGSAELFSEIAWIRLPAAQLLGKFEVGQESEELLGKFEVGQDREDLLGRCVVRHVGAPIELFGKLVMRREGISVELLGKVDITHSVDLLARVEIGQDSQDLEATFYTGHLDSENLSAKFRTGVGVNWLDGWTDRKRHWIGGSTSGTVKDYVHRIVVHYGAGSDSGGDVYLDGGCRTDFGDVRFTAYDGSTLLDYWLEFKSDSDYAYFWVEVDEIPASPAETAIYVYYGSPSSTSVSTSTIFNYFYNFENTLNSWVVTKHGDSGDVTSSTTRKYVDSYSARSDQPNTGAPSNQHFASPAITIPTKYRIFWAYNVDVKRNSGSANGFKFGPCTSVEDGGTYAWWLNAVQDNANIHLGYSGGSVDLDVKRLDEWLRFLGKGRLDTDKITLVYWRGVSESSFGPYDAVDVAPVYLQHYNDNFLGYLDAVFVTDWVDPDPTDGVWDDYS